MGTDERLTNAWKKRVELRAKQTELEARAEDLRARANTLDAKARECRMSGDRLWDDAILAADDNIEYEWEWREEAWDWACVLSTGEVFEPIRQEHADG